MFNKTRIMYDELFPNGSPPGSPEFSKKFLKTSPIPNSYTIGKLSNKIKNDGIESSNDPVNPINVKVLEKYSQSSNITTKPQSKKRKVVRRLKKVDETTEPNPDVEFSDTKEEKTQISPNKLTNKPPMKKIRFIVKDSVVADIIRPIGTELNGTTPPVRRTDGEIQPTPSGLNFYKISPLRLESVEITEPMDGLDFPPILIPIRSQYLAPGKSAHTRPIVKADIKMLASHKAGELSSIILRDIDESKLSDQRHSENNQYYSNKEIEIFAHTLGITAPSRAMRVKMIREKIATMNEKK